MYRPRFMPRRKNERYRRLKKRAIFRPRFARRFPKPPRVARTCGFLEGGCLQRSLAAFVSLCQGYIVECAGTWFPYCWPIILMRTEKVQKLKSTEVAGNTIAATGHTDFRSR